MPHNSRSFVLSWTGSVVLYACASLVLLCITYSVSDEVALHPYYSRWYIIGNYLRVAGISTLLGLGVASLLPQLLVRKLPVVAIGIFQGFCALSALCWFAFRMGTITNEGIRPEWIEQMRSPFFGEWQFLNFIVWNAVPLAIASGSLRWWWNRDRGEVGRNEPTVLHLS